MLIEIARRSGDYVPDLSFGTHFFQDLVEARIRYLPLYPDEAEVAFNEDFLLEAREPAGRAAARTRGPGRLRAGDRRAGGHGRAHPAGAT